MTSLTYQNLDDETRRLMVAEITADIGAGGVYISNYLNETGVRAWPALLLEAARAGGDDTLSRELTRMGCFKSEVQRKLPKGAGYTMAKVPYTAADTLAESQFNMYYMRALALRAMDIGASLIVYRAKEVENPRSSSEAMIGTAIDPAEVLSVLRQTKGVEPATNIPLPNTGITVRLGPPKSALGIRVVGE